MDKNINFLIFGRFPTERAYGVHVVSSAKSFQKYGKVKVIYPSTNNPKTIDIRPEKYFSNSDGIIFEKINFYDITNNIFFKFSPNFIKQFLWLFFTYLFGKKVRKKIPNKNNEINWSTSSVLLYSASRYNQQLIFELHGRARKIQSFFLRKIYDTKYFKKIFISTSKYGTNDLNNRGIKKNLFFMPNGVDLDLFQPNNDIEIDEHRLKIGYVGQLHTYGVEKGIVFSLKALDKALEELRHSNKSENIFKNISFTIVGGSYEEHQKITELNNFKNFKINFFTNTNQKEVARILRTIHIGLVPYPKEEHIAKYSSSLKLFEYISSGVGVIASDVEANKVFDENIGIKYFEAENFESLKNIFKYFSNLENLDYLKDLIELNKGYRDKLSWDLRTKKIFEQLK